MRPRGQPRRSSRGITSPWPPPLVEGQRLDQPEFHRFVTLSPDADGLYRSRVFPGLWLDPAALLERNTRRLRAVLDQGLATREHAAFVARLTAVRGGTAI
jgi:hypothetical protein